MSTEPETTEDDLPITMRIAFHNGDEMSIERVTHGMGPLILIRPTWDTDNVDPDRIQIDATGPGGPEELADFLDIMAEMIRTAEVTHDSRNDDDQEEGN